MRRIAGVVLAAGASRRMGTPKQLLRLEGTSLVRRATLALLASRCAAVFVVVGARGDRVAGEVADLEVSVVDNPRWREGLSRSVRCAAEAAAGFDALLLTLADQPRVTTGVLDRLIGVAEREARDLVACSYAETLGAPALFGSRYFEDLRALDGDRGAKSVLERHAGEVAAIPVADAALDLDTPADLARRSSAARSGDSGRP